MWQLRETRTAYDQQDCYTAAGHRCTWGIDQPKPTRLLGDIPGIVDFGFPGWPRFDSEGYYLGPLPKHCGHDHKAVTIGRDEKGGFKTSPTATYPDGMCHWIAKLIFDDWTSRLPLRRGGFLSGERDRASAPQTTSRDGPPTTPAPSTATRPDALRTPATPTDHAATERCVQMGADRPFREGIGDVWRRAPSPAARPRRRSSTLGWTGYDEE